MTQLPPAYAPTRRSLRPAPGQPIEVAVVPGHGANSGPAVIAPPKATATTPRPTAASVHRTSVRSGQPQALSHSAAPRSVSAQTIAPQAIAPRALTPRSAAPQAFAPESFAPTPVGASAIPPTFIPASFAPKTVPGAGLTAAAPPQFTPGSSAGYAEPDYYGDEEDFEPKAKRRLRPGRIALISLVGLLVLVLAWPVGLMIWANGQINHVDALSGRRGTAGTTFLLAGVDTRTEGDFEEFGVPEGDTSGSRSDSILLLHRPRHGPTSLISLPRDTYVQIPGHGGQKLNAAYAFGGPELLVATVEELTGLTVDHYVEVGMAGLGSVVNAVGGVELCMDRDVDDWESQLVWYAGCHWTDGRTALAFARMRYSDPMSDIGRADRQRQVLGAIMHALLDPQLLLHPGQQVPLLQAGLGALRVDENASILTFASLALAFRAATGPEGVMGTPPISDLDFRPGQIGSAVLIDPNAGPQFWLDVRDGRLDPGRVGLHN